MRFQSFRDPENLHSHSHCNFFSSIMSGHWNIQSRYRNFRTADSFRVRSINTSFDKLVDQFMNCEYYKLELQAPHSHICVFSGNFLQLATLFIIFSPNLFARTVGLLSGRIGIYTAGRNHRGGCRSCLVPSPQRCNDTHFTQDRGSSNLNCYQLILFKLCFFCIYIYMQASCVHPQIIGQRTVFGEESRFHILVFAPLFLLWFALAMLVWLRGIPGKSRRGTRRRVRTIKPKME